MRAAHAPEFDSKGACHQMGYCSGHASRAATAAAPPRCGTGMLGPLPGADTSSVWLSATSAMMPHVMVIAARTVKRLPRGVLLGVRPSLPRCRMGERGTPPIAALYTSI
jgi:hypothetical protein